MPFGLQPLHLLILLSACLLMVGGIAVLAFFVVNETQKRNVNPMAVDNAIAQAPNNSIAASTPSENQRLFASMKSYTGSAVLVFFLYYLFWLPGFIVNYIFYDEAKRMERTAGQSLPGVGCLTAMLWFNVAIVIVGVLFVCMVVGVGGLSSLVRR